MISRSILLLAGFAVLLASEPTTSPTEPQMRVISYNVLVGFRQAEDRRLGVARWLAAQQPDVVALLELNDYTEDRLRAEAAAWGHPHAVLLKEKGYPVGLTSRTPITEAQRVLRGFHHGLIRARTAGIVFYVVHTSPSDSAVRQREAANIVDGLPATDAEAALPGATASLAAGPVIVLGDFNALSPADRDHYAAIDLLAEARERQARLKTRNLDAQGQLDYRCIARFLDAGLVDVVREKHADPAALKTYPTPIAEHKVLPRRIDYLFVSPDLARTCRRADVINEAAMDGLSDHYPLVADFAWPPR